MHREPINRVPVSSDRRDHPPVVHRPSRLDVWINGAFLFIQRLGWQLLKTLVATSFAAAADAIRKKGDPEAAGTLNKHGGLGGQRSENQSKMYGSESYQTNYPGHYNGGYEREPDFPGFGG